MHSLTLLLALASSCILQCNGQLSPFEETLAAIRFVHLENDFQVFLQGHLDHHGEDSSRNNWCCSR